MKVINVASNFGSLFTALRAGYVLVGVGLISAVASILGHYIGAGLAIKNGSKIVKPTVIAVLLLLTVKVGLSLIHILARISSPRCWRTASGWRPSASRATGRT